MTSDDTRGAAPPAGLALDRARLDALADELEGLREECVAEARDHAALLEGIHPTHRASATNLLHYVALRRRDIRGLQTRLAELGLSSLGRSEAHVLVTLDRVLAMLDLARGRPFGMDREPRPPVGFRGGKEVLATNASALLGRPRSHRSVRILVTLPSEAAEEPELARDLVDAGMDCARINCAHDDPAIWRAMVEHVGRAAREVGAPCRILMDLAGPKLRTGALPHGREHVRLGVGDGLWLVPNAGARTGSPDEPVVECDEAEVFRVVEPGHTVWFDDGKLGGRVERVESDGVLVRITHAKPSGAKLKSEKGINLPDTRLDFRALGEHDLDDLRHVVRLADLVGISFVQGARDVTALQDALTELGGDGLGIVLKIETRTGFEHLTRILLAGMASRRFGVMIARGDLAVEMGFERMAEIQEEILWIAEAAHAPTIWATQVLETLAKEGVPSRPEVTDAAMSGRAEGVMLNKGPYAAAATRTLDDILARMQAHQSKKRSLLRSLHVTDTV